MSERRLVTMCSNEKCCNQKYAERGQRMDSRAFTECWQCLDGLPIPPQPVSQDAQYVGWKWLRDQSKPN